MLYLLNKNEKTKIIESIQKNIKNVIRIERAKEYVIKNDNKLDLIKDGVTYIYVQNNTIYEPTEEQLEKYKILYYQHLKEKRMKKREETLYKLRKKYEPIIEYIITAKVIIDDHINDSNKTLTDLVKCLIDIRKKYYISGITHNILDYTKDYQLLNTKTFIL